MFYHFSGKLGRSCSGCQSQSSADDHGFIFFNDDVLVLFFHTLGINDFIGKQIGRPHLETDFRPTGSQKRSHARDEKRGKGRGDTAGKNQIQVG